MFTHDATYLLSQFELHLCVFHYLTYVYFYLIYVSHTVSLHTLVHVLAPQYVTARPGMCGSLRLLGGDSTEYSHVDGALEGGLVVVRKRDHVNHVSHHTMYTLGSVLAPV